MLTFQEIKLQAEQYRNAKKYAEALPLYQDIWENHKDIRNHIRFCANFES